MGSGDCATTWMSGAAAMMVAAANDERRMGSPKNARKGRPPSNRRQALICPPGGARPVGAPVARGAERQIGIVIADIPLHARPPAADVRFLALGDSYTIGESVAEADRWPVQL